MNQKQKDFIRLVLLAVFVLIVITTVNKCLRLATIRISNLPEKEIYLNSNREKLETSNPKEGRAKLRQKLDPGVHILYYDENPQERWYAAMRLKKGENQVKLNFRRHQLPYSKKKLVLSDKANADDVELESRFWNYSIYNRKNKEIYYNLEINYSLRGKRADDSYVYTAKFWLDVNGSAKSNEQIDLSARETRKLTIFEDDLHLIAVEIITSNNTASFELKSVFAEYKKELGFE